MNSKRPLTVVLASDVSCLRSTGPTSLYMVASSLRPWNSYNMVSLSRTPAGVTIGMPSAHSGSLAAVPRVVDVLSRGSSILHNMSVWLCFVTEINHHSAGLDTDPKSAAISPARSYLQRLCRRLFNTMQNTKCNLATVLKSTYNGELCREIV